MKKTLLSALAALCCLVSLAGPAAAAQVDCDAQYCFSQEDFSQSEEPLAGICITGLPDSKTGTVLLGQRVLRPGDILTAGQLSRLVFCPLRTEEDAQAVMTYLPIYEHRVEHPATVTVSVRGKKDQAPVAEDFSLETYKNLPNDARLRATDPEGEALTYTLIRQPRRGEVTVRSDGTFTYTPKKNKVGTDSFTYTATDPAGNVSREATVTVQILKPADKTQYADTAGQDCRFEAEWLKNTGIFEGERLGGRQYFGAEKTVSRGQFLSMLVQVLQIPTQEQLYSAIPANTPQWLKPYAAAALRAGLLAGLPEEFDFSEAVSGAEAAVMLQNALDLSVSTQADLEENADSVPAWALSAVNALADNGLALAPGAAMTRGEAAKLLYRIQALAPEAPGMLALRSR